MRVRWFPLPIAALALMMICPTARAAAQLTEYYNDWDTSREGASITSPSKTLPGLSIQRILDQVKGEDGCIFADGIEQREEFTIDLGKERLLGQVVFINTTATVYGEIKRVPNSFTVSISTESAQGPWKTVYTRDPADITDSFALDNVPVRWLHFDLGVNKDGVGSRVGKVKIFKRYLLKSGPELMRTFCNEFRRDADGLQDFWRAVDAQQWDTACDAIIQHYSHAAPVPKSELPQWLQDFVNPWMENTIAGCKFPGPDWDWLQRQAGRPNEAIGLRPGGSTVFALLSSAYARTGNEAYAKQLAALLRDWLQDMPCPGVHRGQDGDIVWGWAGLEVSSRTTIFCQVVDEMFPVRNASFSRDMKVNLLYAEWENLNFLHTIEPELGGNWLTNVNSNFFDSSRKFAEFRQQKQWLEDSKAAFELSLSRDVHPSGKEKEDSTMYMPFASLQMLDQYGSIRRAGVVLSAEAEQRMSHLFDCIASVAYPDRSMPSVGDCHRDSTLSKNPPVREDYLTYFNRPDLLYVNTQGRQGTMPSQASRAFSDTGWYIMRTAWDTKPYEDARQMFFKCSTTRGHGHPDQLEVTMYAYGREILTDPGMPSYGQPIEDQVHNTSAHNTICVDEKDQTQTSGTEKAWASASRADFVDVEFQGYRDIDQRRQIVFLKPVLGSPDYWLIHDAITGTGNHKLDLNFHFSADANPKVESGSVCSTYPDGGNALIRLVDQSAKPEVVDSSIALVGSLVPSKTARYRKEQAVPATFDTVVVPFKGSHAPNVATKVLKMDSETADRDAVCVLLATDYGFDAIAISSKPGSRLSFDKGRIKTDASALVIRFNKKGKIIYAFQCGGTATEYKRQLILQVKPGAGFSERKVMD